LSIFLRIIYCLLIVLPLACTFVSGTTFGSKYLTPLFFFVLSSLLGSMVILLKAAFKKRFILPKPVPYIFLLFLLIFGWLTGVIHGNINLIHFLWLTISIYWFSICCFLRSSITLVARINDIHFAILLIALVECIIMLLQSTGVIPVYGELYFATGSLSNPNITANFLALSLFSWSELRKKNISNFSYYLIFSLISISIIISYCRSAYLVFFVFLIIHFGKSLLIYIKKQKSIKLMNVGQAVMIFFLFLILISPFINGKKIESLTSRLEIWQITLKQISYSPMVGYGFGSFERSYNAANSIVKDNNLNYVVTAYNDFIEITFELGVIGLIFWCLFLYSCLMLFLKNRINIFPVVAIVIIQCTNFGFRALPVIILFLIYLAISFKDLNEFEFEVKKSKFITIPLLIATMIFFLINIVIAGAYFEQNRLAANKNRDDYTLNQFKSLENVIGFSSSYWENYGDALMKRKYWYGAIEKYSKALMLSSRTDLLAKKAFCFQMIKNYDSSEVYFTRVENITPQKLIPRFNLLKLYEQKKDTAGLVRQVKKISTIVISKNDLKAKQIKQYSAFIQNGIDSSLHSNN